MNQFNLSHFSDYTDEAPLPRPDFDAYLQQSTRHELKQQIIANQSNRFTPEQLDSFSTDHLRKIATLASGTTSAAKSSTHYVNDGGLFGEGVSDDEGDEAPLPRPAGWI